MGPLQVETIYSGPLPLPGAPPAYLGTIVKVCKRCKITPHVACRLVPGSTEVSGHSLFRLDSLVQGWDFVGYYQGAHDSLTQLPVCDTDPRRGNHPPTLKRKRTRYLAHAQVGRRFQTCIKYTTCARDKQGAFRGWTTYLTSYTTCNLTGINTC